MDLVTKTAIERCCDSASAQGPVLPHTDTWGNIPDTEQGPVGFLGTKTFCVLNSFDYRKLLKDDLSRVEMYKANAIRVQLQENTGSYEDFLKSLDMKATIREFEPIYIQRIAQLTNKSNQFNLTTLI